MSKTEKIGRPSMVDPESGANIELGQPVLENEFEKESIEATFPVIKEALDEFYMRRAIRDPSIASALQTIGRVKREQPYAFATWELSKEKGATLALAIIESAQGELQYERSVLESYELEIEDSDKNQEIEITGNYAGLQRNNGCIE